VQLDVRLEAKAAALGAQLLLELEDDLLEVEDGGGLDGLVEVDLVAERVNRLLVVVLFLLLLVLAPLALALAEHARRVSHGFHFGYFGIKGRRPI